MNQLAVKNWYFLFLFALLLSACKTEEAIHSAEINLAGSWVVVVDSLQEGENAAWYESSIGGQAIQLPSTLDQANMGELNDLKPALNNYVLSHLARKREYIGQAWYQKEIEVPKNWEEGKYFLELERILWESTVWVNGTLAGKENSLVTPHRFDLSQLLKPGKNTITIRVDNSNLFPYINVTSDKYPGKTSGEMGHAYTNHTQIKWNGILGGIRLEKTGVDAPHSLRIDADWKGQNVDFQFVSQAMDQEEVTYEISLGNEVIQEGKTKLSRKDNSYRASVVLTEKALPWDEFNPNLYQLKLITTTGSVLNSTFGFRSLNANGKKLTLNDNRIYLRGTLECAIFPLDGSPYLDKASWKKMIKQAKAYGLNHLRFHSWCPPKAAFEAADELGFYLQAELPHWSLEVGKDAAANEYLQKEASRILAAYGNHPSFVLMSMGNELEGDFSFLNGLVERLKSEDDRRLYSTTTFSFQEGAGAVPQSEDEFFVTQWTNEGWIRGQGIFNAVAPHFNKDYRNEMDHIEMPVISHEIGQYSVYPDLREIDNYTGTLTPLNFIAVKEDLEAKGLLPLASDFTRSSGTLAAILYKEEIERALKTPEFDGFQLLQLQDFPGQGTALVGLLNAFWESKGVIDSTSFKQFCSPVTPLLRFEKAVYKSGEDFTAEIQVANFWKDIETSDLRWAIKQEDRILHLGDIKGKKLSLGNENFLGEIKVKLQVDQATCISAVKS
ncbi:MAG: sugar-binding domain-containing protein, partial [Bacteroidota bacterium]